MIAGINAVVKEERERIEQEADECDVPKKLRAKLRKTLKENPEKSWDEALYEIVRKAIDEETDKAD